MIKSGDNKVLNSKEFNDQQKVVEIAYGTLLSVLGYDWEDDTNMCGTPRRVAKMFMNEITKGSYSSIPEITVFENRKQYSGMIFSGNISVKSLCSHHMLPFVGKAFIAYIPRAKGKVIGLSKFNRIVDWFARRPQLQENLTTQIHDFFSEKLKSHKGVAVMIECDHMCIRLRGVEDQSTMITTKLSGAFLDDDDKAKDEFYKYVDRLK